MLTRDLFAVANYSVVYYVHRLSVCFCVFATCCCETSLYIRYTCHSAVMPDPRDCYLQAQPPSAALSVTVRRRSRTSAGVAVQSALCDALSRAVCRSVCALVSTLRAYIIAAWWPEWRTWTIIKLPHNNFLPLLAGNPTLEIPTSATTDRNWSLIYILSPDKW